MSKTENKAIDVSDMLESFFESNGKVLMNVTGRYYYPKSMDLTDARINALRELQEIISSYCRKRLITYAELERTVSRIKEDYLERALIMEKAE